MTEIQQFTALTLDEWCGWLDKHHTTKEKVLLVRYKKHTGRPTFSNAAAMDEAICFGWIDTTIKRIDDDRYAQRYVKRGPKSRWSHNTVSHAKRLMKEGRMTPAGKRAYEEGMKRPLLERFPKNPLVPPELERALRKNKKARAFFETLAPTYRRTAILMVERAKLPETRERRTRAIMQNLKAGKRPGTQ